MMDINDVRTYCLSKPCVTEDMPFGEDYVTFRIGGKIFVGLALTVGRVVQMKCLPAEFDQVLTDYPYVEQAWHWHKRHWIQVDLDQYPVSTDVLCRLIDRAYEVVVGKLPRKTRAELGI